MSPVSESAKMASTLRQQIEEEEKLRIERVVKKHDKAKSVVDENAMAEPMFEDDEEADQVASLRGTEWEI